VTANDAYKILRSVVGPWFRSGGFEVAKNYLTYRKHVGRKYFSVRFQCHHQGWEKHRGSSFIVLVQLTNEPDIDYARLGRLTEYLALDQLEFIRARQNRVLASIPQPPAGSIKPYKASDDIWFRYFTEEDVRAWGILLLKHVQNVHARVEANR
jgi:hypothetical protein